MTARQMGRWPLAIALLSFALIPIRSQAGMQEHSEQEKSASANQGGEHSKETHDGAEEEEHNAALKYSGPVQLLGRITGLNVHQAYWLAMFTNFALIVFLIYWFSRKSIPRMMQARTESIRKALEEARAASQEANRRLAEIETRLRQLDVEIGQMHAAAEKDGEAEDARIRQGTEEEVRKVVTAAEQEIVAAAKQVRRELAAHTADLAIALARKQINVDSGTDQALVRDFAEQLSSEGGKDRN